MSTDETDDHTHRVIHDSHIRFYEGRGKTEYEVGSPITPTENELDAFPDRFERHTADETDEDATQGDAAPADDETDADTEQAEQDAESGDEDEAADGGFTADAVEDADYSELRGMAREFDEMNGNWGEDRLRAELLAVVSED